MVEETAKSIRIDLNQFKLHLYLKPEVELTLHFDSPSRRFYLSVIGLVVHEMKRRGRITSIPLQKHLGVLASPEILGFALALTGVAIVGKQICGLGVRERDTSRLAVGIGMVPRGEVGLVFAGVGASLSVAGHPIIDPAVYGALVLMVFVTTLVTPSLMVAALSRHRRALPSRG